MPDEGAGTLWEHVYALRSHILTGGLFFVIAASVLFTQGADLLISYLLRPLQGEQLVFLSPLGPFLFKIRVSLYGGLILSLPIWIGLGLHFVLPALTIRQKVVAIVFVLLSMALTIAAMAVAYFYLVPTTLTFLLSFVVPGTSFLLSADSYLGFVLLQGIVAFIILQLPLVIVLIAATGLVSPYTLAAKRHFLYPALLILLAVLTPTTDAVTLALVSIPAALLAEIGMMAGKLLYKRV